LIKAVKNVGDICTAHKQSFKIITSEKTSDTPGGLIAVLPAKGLYAILVAEDGKDYLSFVTERDCCRFNCMPFGCCGATATYNRMVRIMLKGAMNMDNLVDSLVAYTSNEFNHSVNLARPICTY
jgi:hypothetical protein